MAYQEGQYISQFLNTLPQQLLAHSQFKEGQRQFDASLEQRDKQFDERSRQFDARAAQRSKEFDTSKSLTERSLNIQEEKFKRQKEEKALIDLLLRGQHQQDIELSEAQARKNAILEDVPFGIGLLKALPWTETVDEWARKEAGFDEIPERRVVPEGLEISPRLYQLIQSLPAYSAPIKNIQDARMNLLNIAGSQ